MSKKGGLFWTCAVITILSAAISMGFATASLLSMGLSNSLALYAASRSLALLIVAIAVLFERTGVGVCVAGFAMTLVQLGDTFVGIVSGSLPNTLGPVVLALANGVTTFLVSRKLKA